MSEVKYSWLKMDENFFNQFGMKLMENLEDGHHCEIVYIKLLMHCLQNNGVIKRTDLNKPFVMELAEAVGEDVGIVDRTVNFLLKAKMMEPVKGKEDAYTFAAAKATIREAKK